MALAVLALMERKGDGSDLNVQEYMCNLDLLWFYF